MALNHQDHGKAPHPVEEWKSLHEVATIIANRMPGERNLEILLRSIRPLMDQQEYVFCTSDAIAGDPVGAFREAEGWTSIVRRAEAEQLSIPFTYPCRMITLTVHSSLEAVGLLAAIATRFAARGISLNVVSAYYHDHLFVPVDRANEAFTLLRDWS
jgi:uncharacterized protein